ncbi:ABC transporter permease [Streptomyces sp. WMMC500]|uniref:ABC transporter permease n=1 Tax=Streptomyces sp. WMMC500 TaxID=3015154 RepID=UPI00248B854A|nr:ABC transporter permease [Streptomyces sp. WMMC500]WBB63516.1 ABC transporter permease [Streptomyces sp. WMMC500]
MFLTYLRRELRRRRKAALVVALGLALGIGLVITVSSVAAGMRDAQDEVLHSLYGVGTDLTVSKEADESDGGPQSFRIGPGEDGEDATKTDDRLMPLGGFQHLDDSVVGEVAAQDGVDTAVGALALNDIEFKGDFQPGKIEGGATGQAAPGQGGPGGGGGGGPRIEGGGADIDVDSFTVTGLDVTQQDVGPLSSSKISDGVTFGKNDTDALKTVVDSAYAKDEGLKVGDDVTIKGEKFEVVGIATADTGAATANVYIPLKRAQELSDADLQDKVSTIYVKADSSEDIPAVKDAIDENVSGASVTSASDLAEQVSGNLSTASDLATNIGKWLSVVVLIAAFLLAGLLTMSAVGRRVREFGTLKALGWRSGRVVRQVMGEAFVNGILGGLLGIALGIGGAYVVTAVAPTLEASMGPASDAPEGAVLRGPQEMLDAATSSVEVGLEAPVTLSVIALAVALAVAGGLIAGLFGGWRAARLRPADALRRVE